MSGRILRSRRTAMVVVVAMVAVALQSTSGGAAGGGIVPVERPEPSGRPSPVVEAIEVGSARLLDIEPAGSSFPGQLTPVGEALYFSATRDGRTTLWRTDGSAAGTVEVSRRPDLSCGFDDFCDHFGVQLLPTGSDLLVLTKAGLWRTDGTELGTIHLGVGPIGDSTAAGDALLFVADDRAHGAELWRSDGTVAGTRLVRDILPGPAGGVCPATGGDFCLDEGGWLIRIGDRVVLPADDGRLGLEPWVSDGTAQGTRLLRDIGPGREGGACVRPPGETLCRVWFRAAPRGALFWAQDRRHGAEPWWTDGTPKGTHLVADLRPGRRSSMPGWAAASLGDRVVFLADVGHGEGLWVTDGTPSGTRLLLGGRARKGASCVPTCSLQVAQPGMTTAGDRVYLTLYDRDGETELWSTDGTAAGTTWVADLATDDEGTPPLWAPAGPSLVFVTLADEETANAWITDGTSAGTRGNDNLIWPHFDHQKWPHPRPHRTPCSGLSKVPKVGRRGCRGWSSSSVSVSITGGRACPSGTWRSVTGSTGAPCGRRSRPRSRRHARGPCARLP